MEIPRPRCAGLETLIGGGPDPDQRLTLVRRRIKAAPNAALPDAQGRAVAETTLVQCGWAVSHKTDTDRQAQFPRHQGLSANSLGKFSAHAQRPAWQNIKCSFPCGIAPITEGLSI